jgi:hypothetical protein
VPSGNGLGPGQFGLLCRRTSEGDHDAPFVTEDDLGGVSMALTLESFGAEHL